MLTKITKLSLILIVLCLSGSALAQSNTQSSQNSQQAAKAESPFVDFSGFKGKVLEVKHREPRDLVSILQPLGSGFKGAELKANSEFKTITVRDFPENIATIEEALKRLDTPMPSKPETPARPDVELHGYVLIASQGDEASSSYPKGIEDVVKQLQLNLNYKSYRLLTTIVQRTRLEGNVLSSGMAADGVINGGYEFNIVRVMPESRTNDSSSLLLNGLNLKFNGGNLPSGQPLGNARITTDLKIRDGEKVVVGTASLRDKALILVLTTKVLK